MSRDPAEEIIVEAMLSGDHETGIRHITCNAAARSRITCACGDCLDQRTVHVIERYGKTLEALCPKCFRKNKDWITQRSSDNLTVTTWDETRPIE